MFGRLFRVSTGACGLAWALAVSAPAESSQLVVETAGAPAIVGRWQVDRTCQGLVQAARRFNLEPLAPSIVGDYFPGKTPQQLARKKHLCRGATVQQHSHFFTSDGLFGSVDQHGQQVDDGMYRVINTRTIRIGNPDTGARFHYRITDRKTLRLRPVITKRMRRQALAHPFEFSPAGWAVAVSYTGHTWERVRCGRWC
jgi:hypothetical protein